MIKTMTMNYVLHRIQKADDTEIQEIISAIIRRYGTKYPDWEVVFLSLPKHDPSYRRETLLSLIEFWECHESMR